jgi:uncharacterized protein (TIGR01370 family)
MVLGLVSQLRRRLVCLLAGLLLASGAQAAMPAVALYYGSGIPLSDFRAFDLVVVDPDHDTGKPDALQPTTQIYAYASVGEVLPSRAYEPDIPPAWKFAHNPDWKSDVIDLSTPGWADFFASRVVQPLWQQGYRGFFLDTLDSYRLAKGFDEQAQQQGLVRVIETLHQRFPGIKLVLNRGFEVLPRVRDKVQMVAAESLYRQWNAKARRYEEVPAEHRQWLLQQLHTVQQRDGLPVLVIDYVAPQDRELTRATADKIRQDGFIPWVTDADLSTIGVGSIEAVPRRVLVLYDGDESPTLNESEPHRFPFKSLTWACTGSTRAAHIPTAVLRVAVHCHPGHGAARDQLLAHGLAHGQLHVCAGLCRQCRHLPPHGGPGRLNHARCTVAKPGSGRHRAAGRALRAVVLDARRPAQTPGPRAPCAGQGAVVRIVQRLRRLRHPGRPGRAAGRYRQDAVDALTAVALAPIMLLKI